jgi:small nuclear ribonucleoprotein (snRNP)-like protein
MNFSSPGELTGTLDAFDLSVNGMLKKVKSWKSQ